MVWIRGSVTRRGDQAAGLGVLKIDKVAFKVEVVVNMRMDETGSEFAREMSESTGRVAKFLGLAERRLAAREAALSADGLEQRFEKSKLFGDDDDHAFRPPCGYH